MHTDETRRRDRLDALALEGVEKEVDAQRVARHVTGDHDVHVVLLGLLAKLGPHVHADDRTHSGVGELFHRLFGTLGAAGHVDPDLTGARRRAALAEIGARALARRDAILGDLDERLLHVLDQPGLALGEVLGQELDDQVVGGRVGGEERHAQQARRVDRLVVVDGHQAALDLVHPLADELLSGLNGHPELRPDVGLRFHHVVQLRQAETLGVVRVHGVDRHALLAQAVGEQDLAGVHVDPAEQRRDLGLWVADVDPRVGEGVRQIGLVGEGLEVGGQLLVTAARAFEMLLDTLLAARVGLDAHAHCGLVDLTKLHGGPFGARERDVRPARAGVSGDARTVFIPETGGRDIPP